MIIQGRMAELAVEIMSGFIQIFLQKELYYNQLRFLSFRL